MRIKGDVPIPPTVVQHEVIRPLVRPGDQHAIVGLAKSKQWVKSIEGLRGVISIILRSPIGRAQGEGGEKNVSHLWIRASRCGLRSAETGDGLQASDSRRP
jgi:hypothetical protein